MRRPSTLVETGIVRADPLPQRTFGGTGGIVGPRPLATTGPTSPAYHASG